MLCEIVAQNWSVKKGHLDGSQKNQTPKVQFEEIQKPPPPQARNEWKIFLFQNFISDQNRITPEIGERFKDDINVNSTTNPIDQQNGLYRLNNTMEKLLEHIRELLGEIKLPKDKGRAIIEGTRV